MKAALKTVNLVTQELETQSLNAIVAGFSFAAAMSWMDVVRWTISQVIKVPKNGGAQYALTAVLTAVLWCRAKSEKRKEPTTDTRNFFPSPKVLSCP